MRGAVERGCYLELNAQPDRLDVTDTHCRMAKDWDWNWRSPPTHIRRWSWTSCASASIRGGRG